MLTPTIDTLFDNVFEPVTLDRMSARTPLKWDAHEDKYVMSIDLPGTSEKDIDIQIQNGLLTVQAEREKGTNGHRSWTRFSKAFHLPQGADIEGLKAEYDHGVLTISVPKSEMAKTRKIPVVTHSQLKEDNS